MASILQKIPFMSETFLGDLSQVKFFDILKPLLSDKKTGKVSVKGRDSGEIYIEAGNIIDSKTDHFSGENAFFAIMSWNVGRITFDPEAFPREKTISISTEQLLLNWSSRKHEFEKIQELVPSTHSLFRLSLQKDGKDKNISADQWNVLALCNGSRTISEIAKTLEWSEYKVLKVLYHLIQMGWVERVDELSLKKRKLVRGDFFSILELELKKAMGPVAPFIIDDKLAEFGEEREVFPEERAFPFIESLSEEIPHPQKRGEFLKTIMRLLSPLL